ncbi:Hpt domain-containing protein [Ruegeria aquimaris]|uniref:Hpt domain-containing protein n=1 Tax=Ruegeria aquimaris TaxID=2984333 RepID=A0ABT3AMA0_9RHOB|nr:Hpt domain-containing protein [Ruegeria sp. XHP0148]MCV2889815.1 Hpt domain-containing protein [Ruegeria sp. XHP0148]
MINWPRVTQLKDEVGAEDFGEVVQLFLEEVDEVIQRLRVAPDPASLGGDLHFLKGSALSLGFQSFSILCQDGERMAAAGRASEVDLAAIIRNFEQSRDVFQAELAAHI